MGLQLDRHPSMICTNVDIGRRTSGTDRASLRAERANDLAGRLLHHTTASTDGMEQMHGTMQCLVLCYSFVCLLDLCSDVLQQVAC